MKAPANFTASATKKVNPLEAAINSNFSQGSSQGSSQSPVRQTGENPSLEAREALLTGVKANPGEETTSVPAPAKTTSRREVKEKFLVSMSKGERSVFKAFCAMQNVSMNHFVMCAMDYFKEDLENGKVSLSAHSYKRKES